MTLNDVKAKSIMIHNLDVLIKVFAEKRMVTLFCATQCWQVIITSTFNIYGDVSFYYDTAIENLSLRFVSLCNQRFKS